MDGIGDMDDLFESVDGFKEDLMDFSVAGLGAVGANIVWGYIDDGLVTKIPVVGASKIGRSIVTVLAGVAGGSAVSKWNKNLATGVAVGLVARGIGGLLKELVPQLPVSGLGYQDLNYSAAQPFPRGYGLGLTPEEQRLLLPAGMAGAPTMVENVNGYGGASTMVEEVGGYGGATTTVQEVSGLGSLSATLQ